MIQILNWSKSDQDECEEAFGFRPTRTLIFETRDIDLEKFRHMFSGEVRQNPSFPFILAFEREDDADAAALVFR